jgi:predicted TPR repeat methyltransferase
VAGWATWDEPTRRRVIERLRPALEDVADGLGARSADERRELLEALLARRAVIERHLGDYAKRSGLRRSLARMGAREIAQTPTAAVVDRVVDGLRETGLYDDSQLERIRAEVERQVAEQLQLAVERHFRRELGV